MYVHSYTKKQEKERTGVALLIRKRDGVRMTSEKTKNSGPPPSRRAVSGVLFFFWGGEGDERGLRDSWMDDGRYANQKTPK